jgi:hypothetical protein
MDDVDTLANPLPPITPSRPGAKLVFWKRKLTLSHSISRRATCAMKQK